MTSRQLENLVILTNGPGEVSGWVHPVVASWRARHPRARITVLLLPCPHASGREASVLAGWPEAPSVWLPAESLRFILVGRQPAGRALGDTSGIVLFLGGDQVFGVLAARRLGWPLFVYTEKLALWPSRSECYLVASSPLRDRLLQRGIPAQKIEVVGDLMRDASLLGSREHLVGEPEPPGLATPELLLLPGSKPSKFRAALPLFLGAAEQVQRNLPGTRLRLVRAAYVNRAELAEAASDDRFIPFTGGVTAQYRSGTDGEWLDTAGGASVQIIPRQALANVPSGPRLALTLPGTNTADLAFAGIAMLVVLPLQRPDLIPLDGLLGQLGRLPLFGPFLTRDMAKRFLRRSPLVALPNRAAGRMVTPEWIGDIRSGPLAARLADMLADPDRLLEIGRDLQACSAPPGSADRLLEVISARLTQHARPSPAESAEMAAPGNE
ncbi:MAG: hypothetical protein VKP62_09210 [Candidatus Sericytochromatia bacterium]|nr:hypothetical protein [Candidatus Sericytochromatia bacterium]